MIRQGRTPKPATLLLHECMRPCPNPTQPNPVPTPIDPVPLKPLKRQSPEEDTQAGVGQVLSGWLLEGLLGLFHQGCSGATILGVGPWGNNYFGGAMNDVHHASKSQRLGGRG